MRLCTKFAEGKIPVLTVGNAPVIAQAMHPRQSLVLAALLTSGAAFAQSTLDWSDGNAWSLGSTTGSYNALSGSGAADSAINTLTYDLGSGLTATVSAVLDSGVSWQNSALGYGGFAPRVTSEGVLALGVFGATDTNGGTVSIHFNQAVTLDSITLGDIDQGRDTLAVTADTGALSVIGSAATAPSYSINGNSLVFSAISTDSVFGTTATSGWVTLSSGSATVTDITFDLTGSSLNHGVWISALDVTAAIPEPSTYAMILGACTLALVAWRRRSRS